MEEQVDLLISIFDASETRVVNLSIIRDIGKRQFDSLKLDIYNKFRKWIDVKTPSYSICKILWIRQSQENKEWIAWENDGYTATSNKYYTDVYYSTNHEIIPASYV